MGICIRSVVLNPSLCRTPMSVSHCPLHSPITKKESVQWLRRNFVPSEYDVFIATYPKCGTTWMQKICVEIMKMVLTKTKKENTNNDSKHDPKFANIDCSRSVLSLEFYLNSNHLFIQRIVAQTVSRWKI